MCQRGKTEQLINLKFDSMKTQKMKIVTGLMVVALLMMSNPIFSQRGYRDGSGRGQGTGMGMGMYNENRPDHFNMIPDLTEEQQAKIEELRIQHIKEAVTLRNQMNELQARQRTLLTENFDNEKEIVANIESVSDLKEKMMKQRYQHRKAIRNILTEEQKTFFDLHYGKRRGMRGNCGRSDDRSYHRSDRGYRNKW